MFTLAILLYCKNHGVHTMKALTSDNKCLLEKNGLTLLRQVMLLSLPLHLFAPSLQPLGFIVKELHKPAAVPAKGGHAACLSALQAGFHQPGFRLRTGRPTGRPVVLPVTEQALRAHRTDGPILRGRAGLRVATEGTTELQALVLHGGKAL